MEKSLLEFFLSGHDDDDGLYNSFPTKETSLTSLRLPHVRFHRTPPLMDYCCLFHENWLCPLARQMQCSWQLGTKNQQRQT